MGLIKHNNAVIFEFLRYQLGYLWVQNVLVAEYENICKINRMAGKEVGTPLLLCSKFE